MSDRGGVSAVAWSADVSGSSDGASGGRLVVAEPFAQALAAAGLAALGDLLAVSDAHRLDKVTLPGWRERLRFEVPGVGPCYLKRYARPPLDVQLGRVLSGHAFHSTARVEWEQIRRLEAAGIGCVTPVAFGERLVGPWELGSALLTAELTGESLERYVQKNPGRASAKTAGELAAFVARFHAAGYMHRDLYLSHVFVERDGQRWTFRLLDLARMFAPRFRRRRWIVKDLASLNYSTPASVATATDRLRFLKVYSGVDRLGREGRSLARTIARKTRRIARHDAGLGKAARNNA